MSNEDKDLRKLSDSDAAAATPATTSSYSLSKEGPAKTNPQQPHASPRMLAAMPLGVLLPELGELSHLYQLRDELKERYKALHAENASASSEASRESAAEESMLNQILQWLSLGLNDGAGRR